MKGPYLGLRSRAVVSDLTPFRDMTLSLRSTVRKYAERSTSALRVCVCVRVCMCARVYLCVGVCVRVCMRERVREQESESE